MKGSEIGSIAQYTIIAQAWSVQLYGDLYKSALMSNGGWFWLYTPYTCYMERETTGPIPTTLHASLGQTQSGYTWSVR